MGKPLPSLSILTHREGDPIAREVAGRLLLDGSYAPKELRTAILYWFSLPPHLPIILDVKRVVPWLGREWQDAFTLYALGFPLIAIARYWADVHAGRHIRIHRDYGDRVIARLVRRIMWLMTLHPRDMPLGDPSSSELEKGS